MLSCAALSVSGPAAQAYQWSTKQSYQADQTVISYYVTTLHDSSHSSLYNYFSVLPMCSVPKLTLKEP